jgi:hypothetical protein
LDSFVHPDEISRTLRSVLPVSCRDQTFFLRNVVFPDPFPGFRPDLIQAPSYQLSNIGHHSHYPGSRTIDVPAAHRIIKHSLPSRRSNIGGTSAGPSSSAAISARQQAERAVAEQIPGKDEGVLDRTGLAGRFRFVASEGEKMVPPSVSPGRGEDDVDMGIEGEHEDEDEDGDEEDGREDEDEDEDEDEGEDANNDDGMEVEEQPSEADALDLLKEVDRDIAQGKTGAPAPAVSSARSKRRRAEDL